MLHYNHHKIEDYPNPGLPAPKDYIFELTSTSAMERGKSVTFLVLYYYDSGGVVMAEAEQRMQNEAAEAEQRRLAEESALAEQRRLQ